MFSGCSSLSYLNINNFDTKSVTTMENMFRGCESLISLNLSNIQISENTNYDNMFFKCSDNLIYCANNELYEKIQKQLTDKNCAKRVFNCTTDLNEIPKKIIYDNGKCVEDCNLTEKYKYEYKGKCYLSCPKGTTSVFNKKNNYLCENFDEINTIQDEVKTEIIVNNSNNLLYKFCQPIDFLKNKCKSNKQNNMITLIKNTIEAGILNDLLEDVINNNKKDIIQVDDNIIYQITTTFNQKNKEYENISTINLGQCENYLKTIYNLSENDSLIIFKYDNQIPDLLIPIIGYELFHPITKELLNLNYCKKYQTNVNISIPVAIDENELYKYNPNDTY